MKISNNQIKDNLTQADYVQKHAMNNEKKISLQIENIICHIEEKKRKIKESLFHNLSHEDSFNHQDLDNGL